MWMNVIWIREHKMRMGLHKCKMRSRHPGFYDCTHARSVHSICFVLISFISLNINITAQNRNFSSKNGRRTQNTANFHISFHRQMVRSNCIRLIEHRKRRKQRNCRDHHASPMDQTSCSCVCDIHHIVWALIQTNDAFPIPCALCSASFANRITEM